MKVINPFFVILILLLTFCCTHRALAGEGQPVKMVFDGNLNQLKKDSSRTVSDPFYFDAAYAGMLVTPYPVKNKITLKINGGTPWFLQSAFSATVRIRITSTFPSGVSSLDTALTINYNTDSAYTNESSYVFTGAYRVKVDILDVITGASWDVWKALLLENELQPFPVFNFSCENNAIQALSMAGLPANTREDEIAVSWGNVAAADEYDLEWTYIDSTALEAGRYGNPSSPNPSLLFENNASRVSITGTSYKIPLLYDNSGILFVRVRPLQYQADGGRTEANWSSNYLPAGLGRFVFKGHERSLNWQATTSFAEEGKRKSVMQYYDGSLRSRQTVTKDNSTQTTVVGESIYDYQGRPVIQVMPAPTLSNLIGYSRNFNTVAGNTAFDKDDFDLLEEDSFYCNASAKPMSVDSGAARYYSPQNPDNNIGIHRFIPDAQGYPFTEVQYTQDNTGRISRQGGVGPTHQLGSGHETQYYYGSPDQEELDALFGTEVGDRSHYFKNMVRDANGQYSISYVDMHGRTIATALAGIPATKMDPDGVTSYAWTKISGGPATISFPNSASTTVTGLEKGVYIFRLTVKDQLGGFQFQDVTITVNTTPGAPDANAGAEQSVTLPVSSVSLTGTATDEGGTITSYSWSKITGGAGVITSPSNASTTVTGLVQGTYVFRLTVTDNTGALATSDVKVNVYPSPSTTPVARFNFTSAAIAVAGWNNLHGAPHAGVVSATDITTGITVSSVAGNWSSYEGQSAIDNYGEANGTYFPAVVMSNIWFQHDGLYSKYQSSKPQLVVSGLNPAVPYTLKMTGSLADFFTSNTVYTVQGSRSSAPVTIATRDNQATGAVFSDVIPDEAGTIKIFINTLSTITSNEVAIISGLQVIENSPFLNVSAGSDQVTKLPFNSVQLKGSAADPQSIITGGGWTKVEGNAAIIVSPFTAITTVQGLEEGTYTFRLTAMNGEGSVTTSDVNVIVYPAVIDKYVIGFNFSKAPVSVPGWTNLSGQPNLSVLSAVDESSGIAISSVSPANWSPYNGESAGDGLGADNTTFFPTGVMKNQWFQYSTLTANTAAFDINKPQFLLSGLTPGIPYTLKMSGSYFLPNFNGITRYTVVGNTPQTPVTLDTKNNKVNGAVFANIQADNNGTIRIYVNTDYAANNNTATISGLQVVMDNMPPAIDAGGDQTVTLPKNFVSLSGSGMDPETGNVTQVTRQLTDAGNNIVNGTTITSVKSLLVPVAGMHAFSYSLTGDSMQIAGCNSANICYDCLYDLRITITDDCANQKATFDTLVRNFSLGGAQNITCNAPIEAYFNFSKYLPEGNYEITKTLTVSQYAKDYYRDSVFLLQNTCKTYADFIEEQKQIQRAQVNCVPSCQQCLDSLGNYESFRSRFMRGAGIDASDTARYAGMAREAYLLAEADCQVLCQTNNEADDILRSMLADVSPPSGQYANVDSLTDKYSIFYTDFNATNPVDTVPKYTRPLIFRDENGEPDRVYDEATGTLVNPNQLSPEAFSQKFKASWAQALLRYHPEACKLDELQSPAIQASYTWDAAFAATDTYQQALANGYLNPTQSESTPFDRYPYNASKRDPLLNVPPYKDSLEVHLREFRNNNIASAAGISLWGLSTVSAMCGETQAAGNCIVRWSSKDSAFNTNSMCTGDLDMAWRNFRQMYLDKKRELIRQGFNVVCNNPSTGVPAATLLAAHHQPAFGNADEYLQSAGLAYLTTDKDIAIAGQKAGQVAATFYADNCKAYAQQWWAQLKPCAYSSGDSLNIITAFVNICKEGSDASHVLGSSTVRPSSTYMFKSFEEVMKAYRSDNYNANCNAYLITAPQSYDQQRAYSNLDTWRKPDSCQCSTINGWYEKYQSSGGSDGSFSGYLARVAGTTISNGTLDSLRQLCNGQIRCEYLAAPISLPPALQCGVKDVCVDCNTINGLYNQYKVEFPANLPSRNDYDPQQDENNRSFERYVNYKTGFNKTAFEYLEYLTTCGNLNETLSCDSLNRTFVQFRDSMNVKHLDAGGCDTSAWRFGHNDQHSLANRINLSELVQGDGYFHTRTLKSGDTDFYACIHNFKSVCINQSNITIKTRLKIPKVGHTYLGWNLRYGIQYAFKFNGHQIDVFLSNPTDSTPMLTMSPRPATGEGITVGLPYGFDDFINLKIEVGLSKSKIYYNEQYMGEMNHGPVDSIIHMYIQPMAESTLVDYLKIYDQNGGLIINEEFNSCTNMSNYSKILCPNICEQDFASYFNQKKNTDYTFDQIDSIYLSTCGYHVNACSIGQPLQPANLEAILEGYKKEYINPSSGFVNLDMRTFAGNKTPAEGPKGVFNVNGQLIGNTVDSTDAAVRQSFAQIWNSDSANRVVGQLTALDSGRFRLVLNPGQTAPCDGIIGMRYYQFDAPVDTIDAIRSGIGCYIDFGDGCKVKVAADQSNAATIIRDVSFGGYGSSTVSTKDIVTVRKFSIIHIFATSGIKTVTLYHSDVKGSVGFDNVNASGLNLTKLKNLRGFIPQETKSWAFHSTQDSTFNTSANLRNFDQLNSIDIIDFANGSPPDPATDFKNNLFGSFANNRNIKQLWLDNNFFYNVLDSSRRPIHEFLPNLRNFKALTFIKIGGASGQFTNDLNFTLPNLNVLRIAGPLLPAQIDSVINQVASGTLMNNGWVEFAPPNPFSRTSASDQGVAILTAKNWRLQGAGLNVDNPLISYSFTVDKDSLKVTNAFTEFFNEKLGTGYNYKQIDSIYFINSISLDFCVSYCDTCYNLLTGPLLCGKSEPIFPAIRLAEINNCSDSTFFAVSKGTDLYNFYRDSLRNHFDSSYLAKCLQTAGRERFTVKRPNSEYHYTLYYYDQAGNLVKTVPPAGVDSKKFGWSEAWSDSVRVARALRLSLVPAHGLPTQYRYNTLNQVVAQQTPDAGQSHFWYDRLGRLAVSQNAKQKAASATEQNRLYSYTLYDALGRISEVGEIKNTGTTAMTSGVSRAPASLQSWLSASAAEKRQITQTIYDVAYPGFAPGVAPVVQGHLRNRVSYTSITQGANPAQYNQATFYSYDIHGNVDTLVQDYGSSDFSGVHNIMNTNSNRFKKLVYRYDLISGKVNEVAYQPDQPDQFYHRYRYDGENRLTGVETSADKLLWQQDARYAYYKHGPLARTVLGPEQVQGLDYAYTLQGWLKGLNSPAGEPLRDMGTDGVADSVNAFVGRDVLGMSLHYYDHDYKAIGPGVTPFAAVNATPLQATYRPLYNGNISSQAVQLRAFGSPLLYNYKYDRLNRLTQMDTWQGWNATAGSWSGATVSTDYQERIAYDPNGNIRQYRRHTAGNPSPMDSMSYRYYPGTNRLSHIKDNANPAIEGLKDIEDQPVNNYSYDATGNLTGDLSENMAPGAITWNVYGKILSITRTSASGTNNTKQITYQYDAAGNRIGKRVVKFGSAQVEHTWYVRDASGNVMGVYTAKKDTTGNPALGAFDLTLSEQHVYGSSRLGIQQRSESVEGPLTAHRVYRHLTGLRQYELSNHLGNVLATVSDKKIGVASTSNSSLIDHYKADVVSAQDYYPFGMLMPGRTLNTSKSKYLFNGKESDNDVTGDGNQYDYGFRIYNPRAGRFLSVDPLTNSFPWYTPYQFAGNMPIVAIDLDGLEEYVVTNFYDKKDKISETTITILTKKQNGERVNMKLQKEDGSYITTQNVLIRNVSYDGTTSYIHQSSLNKQQKNIVANAMRELIDPKNSKWSIGFGGGEKTGGDKGENLESERKDFNFKYNLSDYSSNGIVKPNPEKDRAVSGTLEAKPLPIKETSTETYKSKISFWTQTASTQYDYYKKEIGAVVDVVKGKSDYSITIYGNVGEDPRMKFSDKAPLIARLNGYNTLGDLALARANAIKSLLVDKGLDPLKIKTALGVPGGGLTATYNITTTTVK